MPAIAEVMIVPTSVKTINTVLTTAGELITTLPPTPPIWTASVVANRKASISIASMKM